MEGANAVPPEGPLTSLIEQGWGTRSHIISKEADLVMAGPDAAAPFSPPTVAGLAITNGKRLAITICKRFVEDREGMWAMWASSLALPRTPPNSTFVCGLYHRFIAAPWHSPLPFKLITPNYRHSTLTNSQGQGISGWPADQEGRAGCKRPEPDWGPASVVWTAAVSPPAVFALLSPSRPPSSRT